LYENGGAEGKLVRLPENVSQTSLLISFLHRYFSPSYSQCGKSAFARVAKAWIPDDQSIPSNVAARIVRRDGSTPEVKALTLDTDFSGTSAGPVGFRVVGVNVPGVDVSAANTGSSQLGRRGISDVIGDAINCGFLLFLSHCSLFIDKSLASLTAAANATGFDINNSTKLEPFDINQKFNVFNKSLSCGGVDATVSVDVNAGAHVMAAVGLVASGSIFPPDVSEFALTTGLYCSYFSHGEFLNDVFFRCADFSAKLNGTLDLQGDLSVTI
jgi:hypothetical protein